MLRGKILLATVKGDVHGGVVSDLAFGSHGSVLLSPGIFDAILLWREPAGQWTVVALSQGFHGLRGPSTLVAQRFSAAGVPDSAFGEKDIDLATRPAAHAPDGSLWLANTSCSLARYSTDAARTETNVVEYYHSGLDHYFMTSSANEVALLDGNPKLGWVRTGESFGAWSQSQLAGSVHVCRFYGDPVIGPNSHFYTGEDFECDFLVQLDARTPKGVGAWHLEGRPFDIAIPSNGACPANLQPVYRVFNGIVGSVNGPNHRYTTDPAVLAAMQAKGWLPEGVHFCAPPRFN
jgi:hypothetical protein